LFYFEKKTITKEDSIKVSEYCFEKTDYKVDFEIIKKTIL
jgi:hypothetical protein